MLLPFRRIALFLLPVAVACSGPAGEPDRGGGASAAPASQDERMAWWREARFGMFVHWGLYAIPAGQWPEGTGPTDYGEWIRDSARIPVREYEGLQPRFDPARFDPDEWVRHAREAGMRYLVITSKHHDGFALYDSAVSEWDMGGTPSRRDLLGELAAACARGGVRFATYHSIMDWHHPDYLPRRPWETDRSAAGADFERYEDYLHAQVREIVTRYHPAVMWFDGEWERTWTHERGVELFELCRSLDPWMLVNNRVDVHRGGMAGLSTSTDAVGDFGTPEQEIPASGLPGVDWETCMTMNDHWGWNAADPDWKSVETLVRNLIDVASKGGNYLLNVGPKADGTFPDQAVERLRGIGAWMQANGGAIHGTRASPFEALEWGRVTWKRDGDGSVLYLHVFERPRSGRVVLPGLGSEPVSARWLADGAVLPWTREGTDVAVALPGELPDPIASVVELRLRGEPIVYRAPRIVAESDIFVRPLEVRIEGGSPELAIRYTLDGSEPTESSPLYERPLEIARSCTLTARAFHRGAPVSTTARRSFEKAIPRPATRAPSVLRFEPGIGWMELRGTWDQLPTFPGPGELLSGAASPVGGRCDSVELLEEHRAENIALQFEGYVEVPEDDVYVFSLASDDGSDLWIGDQRVVDNDGLHGTVEVHGRAALAKGRHPVRVRWFNKTGGAELVARWAPLGGELRPLGPLVVPRMSRPGD